MKEFLGMPHPNEHRYPLPAHNTGEHEYVHCGDPANCWHTVPQELPEIVTLPVPNAEESKLIFVENASKYADLIEVNSEIITQDLIASGFTPEQASSFAIIFHDKEDLAKDQARDRHGWYNKLGFIHGDNGAMEWHHLAIHVVLPQTEKSANVTVWHEFGHGHQDLVQGKLQQPIYSSENNLQRTKRAGKAALVAGPLLETGGFATVVFDTAHPIATPAAMITGALMVSAGIIMNADPKSALWQIDRGEIYARRYAHKRRQIKPVTINK